MASFALYAWLAMRNPHVGFLADDALYLLMAEIYSPYRDAVGPVYEHVRLYSHLPAFYPWLLAMAGAGPDHLPPARLVNAACMALVWPAFYWWQVEHGVQRAAAFAMSVFFAVTPVTLLYVVDCWSEGLFVLLVFLVLGIERVLPRRPSLVALIGLGMLIACTMQTRSIGVALVPAVLIGMYRRGFRALSIVVLGLLGMLAMLSLLDMGAAAPPYSAYMLDYYAGDPLSAVMRQLQAIVRELPRAARYDLFLAREVHAWQLPVYALLLLVAARGLLLELKARSVLVIYALGYLAIAFSWPFPEQTDRFLYPMMPVLAFMLWRGSQFGEAGPVSRLAGVVRWLPIALGAVLVAPALWSTGERALTPVPDPALDSFRSSRYWLDFTRGGDVLGQMAGLAAHERAAQLVARQVPIDQCVISMHVHIVLLHGRRPSFLPPSPATLRTGKPWACRYFLLSSDLQRGQPAFYPLDELRAIGKGLALVRRDERDPASPPVALLMRLK